MAVSFDLSGRKAIVTGANAGIGHSIAVEFARAGADVALLGRSASDDTIAAIEVTGRKAADIRIDFSNIDAVDEAMDQAMQTMGGLDILVNNAGILKPSEFSAIGEDDWNAVIDTNLKSMFFLCQAAARHMTAQGSGKIINLASLYSFLGGQRIASYTVSKHGVAGLTRALASELGPHGIQVNAIAPGWVSTRNTAAIEQDEQRSAEILGRIPAGRWGQAEDVAAAAVFFASPAADFVNGQVLAVDGGWMTR